MENREDEIPLLHLLPLLQRIIGLTETHKKFGVTKTQLVIFFLLHLRGSATMGEIAQGISASKEQATRAVATLCDSGLVERYEDPANRTRVYVRLTETGREYLQKLVLDVRSEIVARLSASLETEDIQKLNESVRTAVEILAKVN